MSDEFNSSAQASRLVTDLAPRRPRRLSPWVAGAAAALVIGAVIVAGLLFALKRREEKSRIAELFSPADAGQTESYRAPVVQPPVILEPPVTPQPSLPVDTTIGSEPPTDDESETEGSASEPSPPPDSDDTRRIVTSRTDESEPSPEPATPALRSLAAARSALTRREMDVAARSLDMAARLAETPAELAYLARMRMLHLWLTDFWVRFDRGRLKLRKGTKLKAGGTVYTIDETSTTNLRVLVGGQPHDYSVRNVPPSLAAALAARWLHLDGAYGKLFLATFWAIDSDGDPGRAVEMLREAKLAGLPVDALAAELVGAVKTETVTKRAEDSTPAPADDDLADAEMGPRTIVIPLGQGISMTFRLMPPGSATLGTGRLRRVVKIAKPYYIGVTEVTQAQWHLVTGANPSSFRGDPSQPVDSVTWNDCGDFIQLLNATPAGRRHQFRLPTKAEWEYAFQAGATTAYFFGDDLDAFDLYGWCKTSAGGRTHPVGELEPNPAGLYDIVGNVWEWTDDRVVCGGGVGDTPEACSQRTYLKAAHLSHRAWGLRLACDR